MADAATTAAEPADMLAGPESGPEGDETTDGVMSEKPFDVIVFGVTYHFECVEIEEPTRIRVDNKITATEYARRHGVSAATVRRWLNDGRIEGDRFMGRWYVNEGAEPPEPTAYGRPRGSRIIRTRQAKKGPFFESS